MFTCYPKFTLCKTPSYTLLDILKLFDSDVICLYPFCRFDPEGCGWWIVRIVVMCRKNIRESSAFLFTYPLGFSTPEKREKSCRTLSSILSVFSPYKINAKRSLETCKFGLIPINVYSSFSVLYFFVCSAEYNIHMNKYFTKCLN